MIALWKVAHFPPSEGLCAHIYFKKLAVWSFTSVLAPKSTKTPPSQPSQRRHLKKAYFSKSSVQCWRVTLISFQWISIIVSLYFVSLFEILRTSCFRVTRFRKSKRSSRKIRITIVVKVNAAWRLNLSLFNYRLTRTCMIRVGVRVKLRMIKWYLL